MGRRREAGIVRRIENFPLSLQAETKAAVRSVAGALRCF